MRKDNLQKFSEWSVIPLNAEKNIPVSSLRKLSVCVHAKDAFLRSVRHV